MKEEKEEMGGKGVKGVRGREGKRTEKGEEKMGGREKEEGCTTIGMREDDLSLLFFTFDISVDNAMFVEVPKRLEDLPSDDRYAFLVYLRQGLKLEHTYTQTKRKGVMMGKQNHNTNIKEGEGAIAILI